ncbi:MAG: hypothetical protein NWF03_03410 [Candidatus Bathyarchaeota archaeon]|nr:hypothetical protein [Candidatus Bathyarchaeota archaeon]
MDSGFRSILLFRIRIRIGCTHPHIGELQLQSNYLLRALNPTPTSDSFIDNTFFGKLVDGSFWFFRKKVVFNILLLLVS